MRLTAVVLPQPEGPNSATTPGVGSSNRDVERKAPRCLAAATVSISGPTSGARGARTIRTPAGRPSPRDTERTASRAAAACSPPGSCNAEYSAKRQRAGLVRECSTRR